MPSPDNKNWKSTAAALTTQGDLSQATSHRATYTEKVVIPAGNGKPAKEIIRKVIKVNGGARTA